MPRHRGRVIKPKPFVLARGFGGVVGRAREITRVSKGGNNHRVLELTRRIPQGGGTDGVDEANIPFLTNCSPLDDDLNTSIIRLKFNVPVVGGNLAGHWTIFSAHASGNGIESTFDSLAPVDFIPAPWQDLNYTKVIFQPEIVDDAFLMYDPNGGNSPIRNAFHQDVLLEAFICSLNGVGEEQA